MDTSTAPNNNSGGDQSGSAQQTVNRPLLSAVIVSLIVGGASGFAGAQWAMRSPNLAKPLGTNPASGPTQKVSLSEDSAIIDVVKKASPAVVSIVISKDLNSIPGFGLNPNTQDPFFNFFFGGQPPPRNNSSGGSNLQEVGAGSGFFVSGDGTILTNKHVVEDTAASYTVITNDGKKYDAQVLARDPVNDLAIVKIKIQNAPKLDLADSAGLQVGQRVIAIGNSLGQYQNTVTSGIISGIGRSITAGDFSTGSEDLEGVIQTDAAINPGNSGGPLLNILGQVIGINTAIDQQGQLVGFAIPSADMQKDLASYQKSGKITRAFLGVRYTLITPALASDQNLPRSFGALIVRGQNATDFAVLPGSPADKAGLVENDIILQVNGTKVDENNSLSALLKNFNPGDTLTLRIFHRGSEQDVKVTLSESK